MYPSDEMLQRAHVFFSSRFPDAAKVFVAECDRSLEVQFSHPGQLLEAKAQFPQAKCYLAKYHSVLKEVYVIRFESLTSAKLDAIMAPKPEEPSMVESMDATP